MRGLHNESISTVPLVFQEICDTLRIDRFSLEGIVKFGNTGLFRATISDHQRRRNLLLQASELRGTTKFRDL